MKNILIVDNSPLFQKHIAIEIGEANNFYFALNSSECITILENEKIDFLLIGIELEGINGIELCALIRKNYNIDYIPIILFSDNLINELRMRAYEFGAIEIFKKNFTRGEIKKFFNNYLKIRENNKGRILLVEDSVTARINAIYNLNKNGYDIYSAKNGFEAINISQNAKIDIILLDVVLPDIDGFKVCKTLKENLKTKNIPIIFLTSQGETSNIVKGFEYGAVDYIIKPWNSLELLARVKTHIDLKLSKEKLETAYIELKELTKMKENFLAIASHDIRSPFSAILGYSQLLLEEDANYSIDEIKSFIKIIKDSSLLQLEYVNSLLDILRFDSTIIILNYKKSKLDDILNASLQNLNLLAAKKGIAIAVNNSVNNEIEVDFVKIVQVLNNLITNAIKFTNRGGNITINCFEKDNCVEIHVIDTGIGINEEKRDKLFSNIPQIHSQGTEGEKGSGLGLLICQNMIKLHNGKIGVNSQPENGSDFYFILPINSLKN